MENWRLFEKDVVNFLNKEYGASGASFVGTGMSDSTQSDIKVIKGGRTIFNIEAKMCNAQSGQFVLLDNGRKFYFSEANKSITNEFSDIILDFINQNYNYYRNVSSGSMEIDIPQDIFAGWIKNHYRNKNVKYIATNVNPYGIIIFPLRKFGEYFDIKANFRRKKSGSSDLPKTHLPYVTDIVTELFGNAELSLVGKVYKCRLTKDIGEKYELHKNGYRYMLKRDIGLTYVIRKLSNTDNPNVIFSIKFVGRYDSSDLKEFYNELRK